jgi:hypothetical protein
VHNSGAAVTEALEDHKQCDIKATSAASPDRWVEHL